MDLHEPQQVRPRHTEANNAVFHAPPVNKYIQGTTPVRSQARGGVLRLPYLRHEPDYHLDCYSRTTRAAIILATPSKNTVA